MSDMMSDSDVGHEYKDVESSDEYEDEESELGNERYEQGDEDSEEDGEEAEVPEDDAERLAEEEKQIKELLKHTSYETLLKLKKEDSGLSNFSKKIKKERITTRPGQDQGGNKKATKAKSKTMPKERNARIPVSRYQTIVEPKKLKTRDPRFDGLSGTLNQDLFQKSYGFLVDQKQNEIKTLQKEIAAAKRGGKKKKKYSEEEIRKLKSVLGKNKEEMNRFKQNQEVNEVKREFKNKAGKVAKPFFTKKSEVKKKLMEKRFTELDRTKKLQKVMDEKKRKQSQRILGEFRKVQKATERRNIRNQKEAASLR